MPTALPPRFAIGTAAPKDAFAAFERRGLLQPSFRWEDVYAQEHAAGFAVAGVAQADVLALFQSGIDEALAGGGSLADFAKAIKPQLVAKGWWGDVEITDPATGETRIGRFDDARLQLIYDVNLRQSYAAGRWARIERTRDSKPLVMYRTMRDERVRASHARWDGVVLPIDHPFWRTHYAPNGWRCRCRCFAVSERDVERYQADGVQIKRDAPPVSFTEFVNRRTGEVSKVPVGIDPGFEYNPGQQRPAQLARLQRNALDAAAPPLARALVRQQLQGDNLRRFLAQPLPGESLPVALLGTEGSAAIGAKGRTVMLPGGTAADAAALPLLQLVIDTGQRYPDGAGANVYVLQRADLVVLARVVAGDDGPQLASLRQISAADAATDAELQRLGAR